jgi:hypothetical protein
MKKSRYILAIALFLSISFAIIPPAVPQIGTYQFHGAAGNQKILKVRTADNASLEVVFGPTYADILEGSFGNGCLVVGAQKKSVVTAVDFDAIDPLTTYPATNFTTNNWKWTTGAFPSSPDDVSGVNVTSLYNPNNITWVINFLFAQNVTIQNAAIYFAQLPTPVDAYLDEIIWATKWTNIDNTVVHNAEALDFHSLFAFQYLANCTETWTYDTTYGAWIGYKIVANDTTIYEFSVELPALPGIPGFEMAILLGTTGFSAIGLIYLVMKKKNHNN